MINTMEVNPEELPALDLFQNCRLCLAKEKVSVDIFSEGHEIRLLYYKIVSCFPVNVTQDDKLPRKICTQCNQKVDDFYQFWTLTAKSQKTLLEWVEKRELLPPAKIKTENDAPGQVSFKQEAMDYSDDDNDLDRYDDDNSEEENNVQPTALVKVCEEGEEGATTGAAAGPSTANIKSEAINGVAEEENDEDSNKDVVLVQFKDLMAVYSDWEQLGCLTCGHFSETLTLSYFHRKECRAKKQTFKYACAFCKKQFWDRHECCQHHRLIHNTTVSSYKRPRRELYECNTCHQKFKEKRKLAEHIADHMGINLYVCDLCGRKAPSRDGLNKHLHNRHLNRVEKVKVEKVRKPKKKYWPCTRCDASCKSLEEREEHRVRHALEGDAAKYQCYYCNRLLSNRNNLRQHIAGVHMRSAEEKSHPMAVCPICGKSYVRQNSLRMHIRETHETQGLACPICGVRVVSRTYLVKVHMAKHTGERPHCCEICGKSFSSKKYLRVHKFSHTGEEPHVCHVCPQKFKQRSSYTLHYRTHHPGVVPPKLRYTLNDPASKK